VPGYTVRRATDRDLADLVRMRIALHDFLLECDHALWVLSRRKMKQLAGFYQDVLAKDNAAVFVACDPEARPVGMLMARILETPNVTPGTGGPDGDSTFSFCRIDDAWVEPDHRRRGLMRRMVGAVVGFMKEQRVEHAMLDYALRNPDSEKCWVTLGFRPAINIANATLEDLERASSD
jgi:ribosomal protein S18 acetylase RimI-like enzyme